MRHRLCAGYSSPLVTAAGRKGPVRERAPVHFASRIAQAQHRAVDSPVEGCAVSSSFLLAELLREERADNVSRIEIERGTRDKQRDVKVNSCSH